LRKVCEAATQVFITNDRPNVAGLILAGSADFKNDLNGSDMFDARLKPKVLKIVDVSYGGENGFNQAVELSQECLSNVKFVLEKNILSKFFSEIATDTGKICYGVHDTMRNLTDLAAVETLLLYEGLEWYRVTLLNKVNDKTTVQLIPTAELTDPKWYRDNETKSELEAQESCPLPEWLAENYS
jgi:peptide chain release factor subunit 1